MKVQKTINILITLSLFCYHLGLCQDYLVTTKGDTIKGEVKPILAGVDKKVVVSGPGQPRVSFGILQIKSYYHDGNTFHTVRGSEGYTFMRFLKSGYLSLYAFQRNNQTAFDGLLLKKIDGGILEVPNLGFKKTMTGFLSDCPTVTDSINSGTWGKRDIEQIVDGYNECISFKTNNRNVTAPEQKTVTIGNSWNLLDNKVRNMPEFGQKNDVLDMIRDASEKLKRGEKIPNYLIQIMRNELKAHGLEEDLERALSEAR